MKVMRTMCGLFVGLGIPLSGPALAGMSLEESFQAALKRSELVAEQHELIVQAEEHVRQARRALLPTVSGTASYFRQESSGVSTSGSNIAPSSQPLVKITGSQPLFRGFRDFAALKEVKRLAEAQIQAKKQAAIQLYEDVTQAFYSRLTLEQDLRNLSDEIGLYQARAKELQARVRIGRSRVSEVLTLNTSLETLKAQMEQTKGQLKVAEVTFAFLTGLPGPASIDDRESVPSVVDPLETYLTHLHERPDVQADSIRFEAAKASVWTAKGAYLPSADFTGNYYIVRSGVSQNADWDLTLSLTMPLFEGGITHSKIREAVSQQKQAEFVFSRTLRQAEEEVRSRYETLQSDLAQAKALERAAQVSEKTYEVEKQDYRLGLVTNLDVLQALTSFEENKRALNRTQFTTKLDLARLESSVARRPKNLGET